jgi:glucoamylase
MKRRWQQRVRAGVAVIAATGILFTAHAPAQASRAATTPTGTALDSPGTLSHFALARKDCLGTAENTT